VLEEAQLCGLASLEELSHLLIDAVDDELAVERGVEGEQVRIEAELECLSVSEAD
jgi:hypothetical protein